MVMATLTEESTCWNFSPNGLTLELHKTDNPAPIKVEPALVSLNDNTIPVILVNVSTESVELGEYPLKTRASPIPPKMTISCSWR